MKESLHPHSIEIAAEIFVKLAIYSKLKSHANFVYHLLEILELVSESQLPECQLPIYQHPNCQLPKMSTPKMSFLSSIHAYMTGTVSTSSLVVATTFSALHLAS